nr:MAG TPA: baseplate component [Caudoviricetes sp.]
MPSIRNVLGDDSQLYENIIKKVNFNLRCCIPGVIQQYDPKTNTASIQPAIREEIVNEDNTVQYMNLPILVNVPMIFPSCSVGSIRMLLKQGDECLVLFSDLSIDNFWKYANVQNPIEVRRHDLSDGIAIPCVLSQPNTKKFTGTGIEITCGSSKIKIDPTGITFTDSNGSITLYQLIRLLSHVHTSPAMGGKTSTPEY